MKCEVCSNSADRSSIIGGRYYKAICNDCYDKLADGTGPSSGQAAYDRDRDAEEHEADTRQPYTDGKADIDFIKLYPETAKKMFSDDEIRQAERS